MAELDDDMVVMLSVFLLLFLSMRTRVFVSVSACVRVYAVEGVSKRDDIRVQ